MRTSPAPWTDVAAALDGAKLAHRGLWDARTPENSTPAFLAAARSGYGIELDVRRSADGEAVVFHDEALGRMTGAAGRLEDLDAAAISRLRLAGSNEAPPTLSAALEAIGPQILVLIEVKTGEGVVGPLEQRVADVVLAARPLAAVIGFNARSHGWFRAFAPSLPRGLNVRTAEDLTAAVDGQAAVAAAAPQFLLPSLAAAAAGELQTERARGRPLAAWTARSLAEADSVRGAVDAVIFEGCRP